MPKDPRLGRQHVQIVSCNPSMRDPRNQTLTMMIMDGAGKGEYVYGTIWHERFDEILSQIYAACGATLNKKWSNEDKLSYLINEECDVYVGTFVKDDRSIGYNTKQWIAADRSARQDTLDDDLDDLYTDEDKQEEQLSRHDYKQALRHFNVIMSRFQRTVSYVLHDEKDDIVIGQIKKTKDALDKLARWYRGS